MNIIHNKGELKQAVTLNGRTVKREDNQILFAVLGEKIVVVGQVEDQDHFLYQHHMPISKERAVFVYGGEVPEALRGPLIMCTCGSDGVILLEGPYALKAICRAYVSTGFHQTSHKIENGVLTLNKKAESERTADPDEINDQNITYKPKL